MLRRAFWIVLFCFWSWGYYSAKGRESKGIGGEKVAVGGGCMDGMDEMDEMDLMDGMDVMDGMDEMDGMDPGARG